WTVISKDHAVTAFASGNTPEVGRYTTLMDVTGSVFWSGSSS
ncbi:UNVERIFIED_ORG: hypothetical protein ABIB19_003999, partial [Arthrobacter sp. UYEF10]